MYQFTFLESFELGRLRFRENKSLRSIVLRTPFFNLPELTTVSGWTSLSTIPSLALSEFVLELGGPPSEFTQPSLDLWGNWDEIDKSFVGFLDRCPDFKLVIRTGTLSDRDGFQAQAKERFPLMTDRNCIQFETSVAIDKHWSKCYPPPFRTAILIIHKSVRRCEGVIWV